MKKTKRAWYYNLNYDTLYAGIERRHIDYASWVIVGFCGLCYYALYLALVAKPY